MADSLPLAVFLFGAMDMERAMGSECVAKHCHHGWNVDRRFRPGLETWLLTFGNGLAKGRPDLRFNDPDAMGTVALAFPG